MRGGGGARPKQKRAFYAAGNALALWRDERIGGEIVGGWACEELEPGTAFAPWIAAEDVDGRAGLDDFAACGIEDPLLGEIVNPAGIAFAHPDAGVAGRKAR